MRYIVTIRADSFVGQALQELSHDGLNGGMPTIDCKSVDLSHHVFLHATRGPLKTPEGERHQSWHIPYQDVLLVTEYANTDKAIGFVV